LIKFKQRVKNFIEFNNSFKKMKKKEDKKDVAAKPIDSKAGKQGREDIKEEPPKPEEEVSLSTI